MIRRIVSYPRKRWNRYSAWNNLNQQQYPGSPQVLAEVHDEIIYITSWRKSHTATAWRWYHDICDHGTGRPHRCDACQDQELRSKDWLGLRDDLLPVSV